MKCVRSAPRSGIRPRLFQHLWLHGLKESQPDKLLSYRLAVSAYMPEVASGAKPVLFGDFSSYWIADRHGRSFQHLNELYAAGFFIVEESDRGYNQPEYDPATRTYTVQWTWVYWQEAPLGGTDHADGTAGL